VALVHQSTLIARRSDLFSDVEDMAAEPITSAWVWRQGNGQNWEDWECVDGDINIIADLVGALQDVSEPAIDEDEVGVIRCLLYAQRDAEEARDWLQRNNGTE
jgi:hypothetical protein